MSEDIITVNNINYDLATFTETQRIAYHVYETVSSLNNSEDTTEALNAFIGSLDQ